MYSRVIIFLIVIVNVVYSFTSTRVSIKNGRSTLSMSDVTTTPAEPEFVPPPAPKPVIMAQWFPFGLKAPKTLDQTLAGDVGFDPLGFSKSKNTLYWMREAETKHARLAMLAAIGWPLSELFHKEIANAMGWESILSSQGRAPSLLNGGLSAPFASGTLIMSIIIAGYLESKAMNDGYVFWSSEKPEGYVPGDFGFDPLKLHNLRGNKKTMETAEIKNGRLAMIAITIYAFSEAATSLPVVQSTPFLF